MMVREPQGDRVRLTIPTQLAIVGLALAIIVPLGGAMATAWSWTSNVDVRFTKLEMTATQASENTKNTNETVNKSIQKLETSGEKTHELSEKIQHDLTDLSKRLRRIEKAAGTAQP